MDSNGRSLRPTHKFCCYGDAKFNSNFDTPNDPYLKYKLHMSFCLFYKVILNLVLGVGC